METEQRCRGWRTYVLFIRNSCNNEHVSVLSLYMHFVSIHQCNQPASQPCDRQTDRPTHLGRRCFLVRLTCTRCSSLANTARTKWRYRENWSACPARRCCPNRARAATHTGCPSDALCPTPTEQQQWGHASHNDTWHGWRRGSVVRTSVCSWRTSLIYAWSMVDVRPLRG